ncbi:class I SAM-dependent DNA methyltransferase [Streptoalloteichus hindustanus]|uniref:Methyltransferase domain-containing protein n=1 Tax=Streptoalloteichus hindustanus TaxID=2017 RepID=A0A1M4YM57_STRHI|nr:class I SAM-dependent methyltransferase [Streptoalloteichus hindustanus]SHF06466.1 Methyltransferase domain-containing protein [Streptoalloteichus hindustanus]
MEPAIVSQNLLTDNPELYEHQFPDPDHRAARFVHDVLRRFGGGKSIVDIGCGTGRDAGHLASLGYTVTGLDLSERMLSHARERHPAVRFEHGDMRSFRLGRRFDAVTCLDSAFLYCHRNEELSAFLDRCREHLTPGGLLVAEMRNGAFFLGNTELLDGTSTRSVTWDGVTYTSRTTLWIDHAEQLLRRHRVWEWPGCVEPLHQNSAWRLLFPQELRHFLSLAGFEVLAMFDQPGPRTDRPWSADAELSTALSADRLHVVARLRA